MGIFKRRHVAAVQSGFVRQGPVKGRVFFRHPFHGFCLFGFGFPGFRFAIPWALFHHLLWRFFAWCDVYPALKYWAVFCRPLSGTEYVFVVVNPALKRWAIVGRAYGTCGVFILAKQR